MSEPSLRTFVAAVRDCTPVTPLVRRLTIGGDGLAGYEPPAPDQFVYVLIPPPGRHELTVDASFTWEGLAGVPAEDWPGGANYTVREHRPAAGEVDIEFVLHDPLGPVSSWASAARPGDPVALWGPRTTYAPPPDTDAYLLVADDTGVPAACAILETLASRPGGPVPVTVLLEVAGPGEERPLPDRPGVEVTWFHRGASRPGTTPTLADAVAALDLPGQAPYAWGGAESRTMTAVRRHLRHERGLPRDRVSMTGYWRLGRNANDHGDADEETGADDD